jgi:hypothetical protein
MAGSGGRRSRLPSVFTALPRGVHGPQPLTPATHFPPVIAPGGHRPCRHRHRRRVRRRPRTLPTARGAPPVPAPTARGVTPPAVPRRLRPLLPEARCAHRGAPRPGHRSPIRRTTPGCAGCDCCAWTAAPPTPAQDPALPARGRWRCDCGGGPAVDPDRASLDLAHRPQATSCSPLGWPGRPTSPPPYETPATPPARS